MKTFFLSLDRASQRVLVIALSVSIVLLSASCLMLTVDKAFAGRPVNKALDIVGLGCDGSYVYYYDSNGKLMRQPKSEATDQ